MENSGSQSGKLLDRYRSLQSLLVALRKQSGMTQSEMSQAIGASQSLVSSWESPAAPTSDQITKIVKVLSDRCGLDHDLLDQRIRVLAAPEPAAAYMMSVETYAAYVQEYSKERSPFEIYLLGPNLLPVRTHTEIRTMWINALENGCNYHLFWILDDLELHEFYTVTQQTFDLARTMPTKDGKPRGKIHHYATWLYSINMPREKRAANGTNDNIVVETKASDEVQDRPFDFPLHPPDPVLDPGQRPEVQDRPFDFPLQQKSEILDTPASDEVYDQYKTRMDALKHDSHVRDYVEMHDAKHLTDATLRQDLGWFWQRLCSVGVHVPYLKTQSPHATVYFSALKSTPTDDSRPCFGFLEMNGIGRKLQVTLERLLRHLRTTADETDVEIHTGGPK